MANAKEVLTGWMVNYIDGRDAILRTLEKIEKNQEGFDIKAIYEDKEVYVVIEPFIRNFDDLFVKIDKTKNISIIMFNSIENFEMLIENWKRLVDFEKLTIYFVNMFSTTDRKWVIKPYLHNKIADEKSLKSGLKSMFNMVDPITERTIETKTL